MRCDDEHITGIGYDEHQAERFLDDLRLERGTYVSASTTVIPARWDRLGGRSTASESPASRSDVSWGAASMSAGLVRRAPEALQPSWERPMLVGDVMHGPVASVTSTATLEDVAALMHGLRVPWVIVEALTAARNGDVVRWHVISDVDLLRATTSGDAMRSAGSIASVPPLCVDVRDDVVRAAAALLEHERPCAMVVEDGLPAGLVSACDIAAVWVG